MWIKIKKGVVGVDMMAVVEHENEEESDARNKRDAIYYGHMLVGKGSYLMCHELTWVR